MATRKQVEESYGRIQRLIFKLQGELLSAQRKGIIQIPSDKYREESPMQPFYEMDSRVDKVFKSPIADAIMSDIRKNQRRR